MYGAICIGLVLFFLIGFVGGWCYGEVKTKIAGYLRIDVRMAIRPSGSNH